MAADYRRTRRDLRLPATLTLFVAALAWRVIWSFGGDFYRVSQATDTVAFALLAGCLLATLHHEHRLWRPTKATAMMALGSLLAAAFVVPDSQRVLLWGELLVVALSMVAVAGCLGRVRYLEARWLIWLGGISYGLYLWHFPLMNTSLPVGLAAALSVVVAWLSFRSLEQPIHRRFHLPYQPKASTLDSAAPATPAKLGQPI